MMLLLMRTSKTTAKRRSKKPEHIEGRQHGRKKPHCIEHRILGIGRRQDLILGEKPGERRDTRDSYTTNKKRNARYRHRLTQSTHLADILLAAHGMDHGTSSKEQQRFKERMRHHMEYSTCIS